MARINVEAKDLEQGDVLPSGKRIDSVTRYVKGNPDVVEVKIVGVPSTRLWKRYNRVTVVRKDA